MNFSIDSFMLLGVEIDAVPSDSASSMSSMLPDEQLTAKLRIELRLSPELPLVDNSPHFPFFTSRASSVERRDVESAISAYCQSRSASCMRLVRYLRSCHRQGIITDVFSSRRELLLALRAFGFHWQPGTLKNAITLVSRE